MPDTPSSTPLLATVPPDARIIEVPGLVLDRVWRSPAGNPYRVVETQEVVADLGWRWGRRRALRFAARMNKRRLAPPYRYAIHSLGRGRWRIVAMQNRAETIHA